MNFECLGHGLRDGRPLASLPYMLHSSQDLQVPFEDVGKIIEYKYCVRNERLGKLEWEDGHNRTLQILPWMKGNFEEMSDDVSVVATPDAEENKEPPWYSFSWPWLSKEEVEHIMNTHDEEMYQMIHNLSVRLEASISSQSTDHLRLEMISQRIDRLETLLTQHEFNTRQQGFDLQEIQSEISPRIQHLLCKVENQQEGIEKLQECTKKLQTSQMSTQKEVADAKAEMQQKMSRREVEEISTRLRHEVDQKAKEIRTITKRSALELKESLSKELNDSAAELRSALDEQKKDFTRSVIQVWALQSRFFCFLHPRGMRQVFSCLTLSHQT